MAGVVWVLVCAVQRPPLTAQCWQQRNVAAGSMTPLLRPDRSATMAATNQDDLCLRSGGYAETQEEARQANSLQVLAPPSSSSSSSSSEGPLRAQLRMDFGDLTFYELIGKGSFKAVYRARWNSTNVACVSMRRGGIVKEARIQQLIGNHPNIVQFYRWTTDKHGNEFIVMEYVEMGSMDQLMLSHGHNMHMRQRLAICEQICCGMRELASVGVLHRDLAGRNILVASLDPVHVKVSDFGLAWIQPDGQSPQHPSSDQLPSIPIRWSPPEVLLNAEWSEKSDVWAFAVTMWELFSGGREPWAHHTDKEVFNLVTSYKVLPRPKKCPGQVYDLMLRCWHKDPAERPTFADILRQFRGWRESYHASKVSMNHLTTALVEHRASKNGAGAGANAAGAAGKRGGAAASDVKRTLDASPRAASAPDPPPAPVAVTLPSDSWGSTGQGVISVEAFDSRTIALTPASRPASCRSLVLPQATAAGLDGAELNSQLVEALGSSGKSTVAPARPHTRDQPSNAEESRSASADGAMALDGEKPKKRSRDISLDYLVNLRAPSTTVVAQTAVLQLPDTTSAAEALLPVLQGTSTAAIALSPLVPLGTCTPATRPLSAPSATAAAPLPTPSKLAAMPLPVLPALCTRAPAAPLPVLRVPSPAEAAAETAARLVGDAEVSSPVLTCMPASPSRSSRGWGERMRDSRRKLSEPNLMPLAPGSPTAEQGAMPQLRRNRSDRSDRSVSRATSLTSLCTNQASELDVCTDSHLSFEFEVPIDPMMSVSNTAANTSTAPTPRTCSIQFSDRDRPDDDELLAHHHTQQQHHQHHQHHHVGPHVPTTSTSMDLGFVSIDNAAGIRSADGGGAAAAAAGTPNKHSSNGDLSFNPPKGGARGYMPRGPSDTKRPTGFLFGSSPVPAAAAAASSSPAPARDSFASLRRGGDSGNANASTSALPGGAAAAQQASGGAAGASGRRSQEALKERTPTMRSLVCDKFVRVASSSASGGGGVAAFGLPSWGDKSGAGTSGGRPSLGEKSGAGGSGDKPAFTSPYVELQHLVRSDPFKRCSNDR